MPQIAQQDYLVLETLNLGELTPDEKKVIRDAHQRGTIFDLILKEGDSYLRIIADLIGLRDTIVVYVPVDQEIQQIDVSE